MKSHSLDQAYFASEDTTRFLEQNSNQTTLVTKEQVDKPSEIELLDDETKPGGGGG